ncbi:MAG: DnaJ-class molecular chaperone [Myxococcota bacterium]|jgi:DnaJ-class molecular chaperone
MALEYYNTLGIQTDATPDDIKRAFRKIARECHPDVTGNDPVAAARFKVVRTAYETLSDPDQRKRYDRKGQRRSGPKGSFFDAFYKNTGRQGAGGGPARGAHDAGGHDSTRQARRDPRNNLDLDDLFGDNADFGFAGGGGGRSRAKTSHEDHNRARSGAQGADVHVQIDVLESIAKTGGSTSATYQRMQRPDSWAPGDADPGLSSVRDIADIRVLPNTHTGQVLRERGLGDAGPYGGPYGDLLAQIRVVADPPGSRSARPQRDAPGASVHAEPVAEDLVVDVPVASAVLGGRVSVILDNKPVRVTIPAGTSSGTRMRLRGKGPDGADLMFRVRITVPKTLDPESMRLMEAFAKRNPS